MLCVGHDSWSLSKNVENRGSQVGHLEVIVGHCVPDLERGGYILHQKNPVRPPTEDGSDAEP